VRKFSRKGRWLLEIGIPGPAGSFHEWPTFSPLYAHRTISRRRHIHLGRYGNACVHRFSPDGRHLNWAELRAAGRAILHLIPPLDNRSFGFMSPIAKSPDTSFRRRRQFPDPVEPICIVHALCAASIDPSALFYVGEAGPALRATPSIRQPGAGISIWTRKAAFSPGSVICRRDMVWKLHGAHGIAVDSVGDIYLGEVPSRAGRPSSLQNPVPAICRPCISCAVNAQRSSAISARLDDAANLGFGSDHLISDNGVNAAFAL